MQTTTYYTNLMRDERGALCWSETGDLHTTPEAAWHEAAKYVGRFGWHYVATASTGGDNATNEAAVEVLAEEQERQPRLGFPSISNEALALLEASFLAGGRRHA